MLVWRVSHFVRFFFLSPIILALYLSLFLSFSMSPLFLPLNFSAFPFWLSIFLLTHHILSLSLCIPSNPANRFRQTRQGSCGRAKAKGAGGREGRRQRGDFRGCLLLWRPSGTKRCAIGVPGYGLR